MNLGVVTVNIPRIALESHGDEDRFWKIFDERMTVAHQALQFRIMRCKQATPVNAPTLFRFGAFGRLGANDSVDQLFRNERATVSLGYIGLYEATSVFYGKDWMRDHDWDPEGKEFALSIVKRMNELCKDWSTAEGYHYSVYSTPAESLTDRFNRMDREKFGEVDGVTDHDFYTNSFHYPVWLQQPQWKSSTTRRTSRTTRPAASSTTANSRACRPIRRRSKRCGTTPTPSASAISARTRQSTVATNAVSR